MLASDLHVHLDGSLRASTLVELARAQGAWPNGARGDEYAARLRFRDGMSLRGCLERFEATVALLQSAGALGRAARELVEDSHLDGARHIEVRVCPPLHTRGGLSADQVVGSVLSGFESGAAGVAAASPGDSVSARIVVTVLEGMGADEAEALAALAARHAGGVVGLDLAGDESLFDAARYRRAFARARDAGLGLAAHAGEGRDASHVRVAVMELGVLRIGHGTAASRDPEVLSLLAERGVTVEACLSSNVHTGAVATIEDHPLRTFLRSGVRVALATDNRFFSSTTLSREYDLARERLGLTEAHVASLVGDSARAAFLPDEERRGLERLYLSSIGRDAP
ncbi:MAG: adenosine deaminase [Candidatus Eisenbacteria bacterium]|nr:adenosine deaminase [Candidatus Eisenbacteria bacterium]